MDTRTTPAVTHSSLSRLSLRDLLEGIGGESGADALREFHENRVVFAWRRTERHLLFAQYLDRLRRNATSVDSMVASTAYEVTLWKFLSLPGPEGVTAQIEPGVRASRVPANGTDCRRYFAAYLHYLDRVLSERGPVSPIEEERTAARILQGFVDRQFDLSVREASRQANPAVSRYYWRVNGSGFLLWFPRSVAGHERRQWLKANVPDAEPHRPGEQQRIQALVNCSFSSGEDLCPSVSLASIDLPDATHAPVSLAAETVTDAGLGRAVAAEKAASIDSQRQSIRCLGRDRLAHLVTSIFEALTDGRLVDGAMAAQFGLSKATYSRFAGSCWAMGGDTGTASGSIPDLWRNTAHVLGRNAVFRETAQRAGVWPRVQAVLTAMGPTRTMGGE